MVKQLCAVLVVFFGLGVIAEMWRVVTGPWSVKPHALIDAVVMCTLIGLLFDKYKRELVPGVVVTSCSALLGFVVLAMR